MTKLLPHASLSHIRALNKFYTQNKVSDTIIKRSKFWEKQYMDGHCLAKNNFSPKAKVIYFELEWLIGEFPNDF
jgi:hypothetical protein